MSPPLSPTLPETPPSLATAGWLLYDGACGVCSRGVRAWRRTLERYGVGVAPLQRSWVIARLGIAEDQLLHDVRFLHTDASHSAGPDVYRFILRQIWWARPLYWVSRVPGFKQVFDAAYRAFAKRRYQLSHTCRLTPV